MSTYREVRLLSVAEAAYLAGLIDGEGTVTLSRKHAGDMRQLVVSISNTELPILEFALLSIGAGKLTNKERAAPITPRAQVEPYMRSYKRERARLVLKDYVRLTPRNGRYTDAMLTERRIFEDSLLGLQAQRKKKPLQPCG